MGYCVHLHRKSYTCIYRIYSHTSHLHPSTLLCKTSCCHIHLLSSSPAAVVAHTFLPAALHPQAAFVGDTILTINLFKTHQNLIKTHPNLIKTHQKHIKTHQNLIKISSKPIKPNQNRSKHTPIGRLCG